MDKPSLTSEDVAAILDIIERKDEAAIKLLGDLGGIAEALTSFPVDRLIDMMLKRHEKSESF